MSGFVPTGSQTVGPFFNFALTVNSQLGTLAGPDTEGEAVQIEFEVLDGEGKPASSDAMIEIWQADSQGRYGSGRFHGFGRLETDDNGRCRFDTIMPGPVDAQSAPHVHVLIFARGLLKHLYTRMYFAGEASNTADAVLQLVPPERRHTLLAVRASGEEHGRPVWRMTIRLQGGADEETVFFDL